MNVLKTEKLCVRRALNSPSLVSTAARAALELGGGKSAIAMLMLLILKVLLSPFSLTIWCFQSR